MHLVTPAGFEPATCPLGGGCSIQLSHGAVRRWDSVLCRGCQPQSFGTGGAWSATRFLFRPKNGRLQRYRQRFRYGFARDQAQGARSVVSFAPSCGQEAFEPRRG